MAKKLKVVDMGPKMCPRYWVGGNGYMTLADAEYVLELGPLPEPLKWDDLCDCGKERAMHDGKHGLGGCGECPSFKDCEV
jgi:hypothetical protein